MGRSKWSQAHGELGNFDGLDDELDSSLGLVEFFRTWTKMEDMDRYGRIEGPFKLHLSHLSLSSALLELKRQP